MNKRTYSTTKNEESTVHKKMKIRTLHFFKKTCIEQQWLYSNVGHNNQLAPDVSIIILRSLLLIPMHFVSLKSNCPYPNNTTSYKTPEYLIIVAFSIEVAEQLPIR